MWVGPSLGWSFYGLVKGSGGIVGLGGDYGVGFRVILGGYGQVYFRMIFG
jgi:hypothetical protein|tara:strand:+ start:392 stop:541 length:150 start_codon:yes stop_codon:yes gene_type:complete